MVHINSVTIEGATKLWVLDSYQLYKDYQVEFDKRLGLGNTGPTWSLVDEKEKELDRLYHFPTGTCLGISIMFGTLKLAREALTCQEIREIIQDPNCDATILVKPREGYTVSLLRSRGHQYVVRSELTTNGACQRPREPSRTAKYLLKPLKNFSSEFSHG